MDYLPIVDRGGKPLPKCPDCNGFPERCDVPCGTCEELGVDLTQEDEQPLSRDRRNYLRRRMKQILRRRERDEVRANQRRMIRNATAAAKSISEGLATPEAEKGFQAIVTELFTLSTLPGGDTNIKLKAIKALTDIMGMLSKSAPPPQEASEAQSKAINVNISVTTPAEAPAIDVEFREVPAEPDEGS